LGKDQKPSILTYDDLKRFFLFYCDRYMPAANPRADETSASQLNYLEQKNRARAAVGLRQAIGDIVEMSVGFPHSEVVQLDAELAGLGIPTFSDVRLLFSKAVRKIARRGHIKNDTEYYLVQNILGGYSVSDREWKKLDKMVSDYEAQTVASRDVARI
jgi:hypothetical protein